ncbi:hypothetical protein [Tabrizicola aquatica]|uniref:hypothetical protein n=1 Tax=Tabrizicola aquatica TaxID=909926 RepID=UPI000CD07804|nr:hypothetical protein [Tabrizicola aquatica]
MTKTPMDKLVETETELVATTVALQEQGLELLLAEMHALKGMMTGAAPRATPATEAEIEAETEAGFDNMPI